MMSQKISVAPSSWAKSPQLLQLKRSEVHVWRVDLDVPIAIRSLLPILSEDEKLKAERFYFQKDRDRFIVGRGLLRQILSSYLGKEPNALSICYNQYGKPALNAVDDHEQICFNLSHSHGLALIAVARNRRLGVDLEYIRNDFSCEEIAERFFSPRESAILRSLPATMKTKAFFTCWTRKEAFVKATGRGLSLPLNEFDVSFIPGEPAMLLHVGWDTKESYRWSLQELSMDPSYVAALAVEGNNWQLKYWRWQ